MPGLETMFQFICLKCHYCHHPLKLSIYRFVSSKPLLMGTLVEIFHSKKQCLQSYPRFIISFNEAIFTIVICILRCAAYILLTGNAFLFILSSLLPSAPQRITRKVQWSLLIFHFRYLLSEVLLCKITSSYSFFPHSSFFIKAPSLTKISYLYKIKAISMPKKG
jgi:hypothetical protein